MERRAKPEATYVVLPYALPPDGEAGSRCPWFGRRGGTALRGPGTGRPNTQEINQTEAIEIAKQDPKAIAALQRAPEPGALGEQERLHRPLGGGLLQGRRRGRPGRDRPGDRQHPRVLDRVPGGVANGPRLPGRVRPDGERALHLAAALRDLLPRPARLAAALPARPPRPARDRRGLRALPLLLQQGQHRALGPAGLSAAALSARPGALARLPAETRAPACGPRSRSPCSP